MAKYIDAESLIAELKSAGAICDFGAFLIERQPTADVQEVKHGRWIKEKPSALVHWHCSVCGDCYYLDEPNAEYCPRCGAKMDGKDGE